VLVRIILACNRSFTSVSYIACFASLDGPCIFAGGFDFKYETDESRPPPVAVARAVPRKDFRKLVAALNEVLHKNRTKTGDIVGLAFLQIL
jgi:hypothetical protein